MGQIPQTIGYQGVLSATGGNAVADGDYSLTFKLYDAAADGNLLWQETQNVSVVNGIFNVLLGNVEPLNLSFDIPYWLGITVGDAELSPRIELTSSAYSMRARTIADDAVSTAKIQDEAVTSEKIAGDQVVKSVNSLKDDVTIVGEGIVTVEQSGNTVTIAAEAGAGEPGLPCWDLNGNGSGDSEEDANNDGSFDALDCQGSQGDQGIQGDVGP